VETISEHIHLHRAFNRWKTNQFEFCVTLAHPITFIDSGITDVISRLQYCERFHVSPFPGDFSSHPDWWKKAVVIMDKAFKDAAAFKASKLKG
jgi:hypothetical protein